MRDLDRKFISLPADHPLCKVCEGLLPLHESGCPEASAQKFLAIKPDYEPNMDRVYAQGLPPELRPLALAWEHYHSCLFELKVYEGKNTESAADHLENARELLPDAERAWQELVAAWRERPA